MSGSTQSLSVRIAQHNAGLSASTKGGVPWEAVHTEQFETRREAISKEKHIKARGAKRYLEGEVSWPVGEGTRLDLYIRGVAQPG